jgi:DNA replication and repair protein RecF
MAPALLRFADRSPPIDRAPEGFARGGAAASVTGQPLVRRLRLRAFRNFAALDLRLAGDAAPVVLHGPNGAGKTNLLEALSLLAPGRGLRRARLDSLDCDADAVQPFRIDAELATADGPIDLATGRDPAAERRWLEVMGESRRGLAPLAELVAIAWLTPAMDRLFLDAAAERRRFLDRLVLAVYPEHARQTALFERAMRERSLLLRQGPRDPAWLRVLEERMAASGVAVAAGRRELVSGLNALLGEPDPTLPAIRLALEGTVERWLADGAAVDAEERMAETLASSRPQDAETGGAAIGPHRSDLAAMDLATGEPAPRASTGRQKAMLIAIVLAEARLRQRVAGDLPILLLDETMAHLDPARRDGLAERLLALGGQVFLTGTERRLFAALDGHAHFIHVDQGTILDHE